MIIKEIDEIKKIIQNKKNKFQKSHFNFQELNSILGKNHLERPNLMLELTAHEILSDSKFLEIIQEVFEYDLIELVKKINTDFQQDDLQLNLNSCSIETFDEIKEVINEHLKNARSFYEKRFESIQKVITKQDVDIDEMSNEFRLIEKSTRDRLEINEMAFKKLEKKYLDVLVYIREKISN